MSTKKKLSIKQQVINAAETLKLLNGPKELRDWAISNGMDNRSAFPKFKEALLEIGIDYAGLRSNQNEQRTAELEAQITHTVTLFTDAKASQDRFAITDSEGDVLWYGKFFESEQDYNGEQSSGELASAKKAVWLASKIKEAVGAAAIELILMVDAQWLCYQDHAGQKGYPLTQLAKKHNIRLDVRWIPGKENPADKWTVSSGFKKWSDNDLTKIATVFFPEVQE